MKRFVRSVLFAALFLSLPSLTVGVLSPRTVGIPYRSSDVVVAQTTAPQLAFDVKANYAKTEVQIPMRDGVKLFTSIYAPRDTSKKYPILLNRTPYSVSPYGADAYKEHIGPSDDIARAGYIVVYQDVRGRLMSEGEYDNMRPHNPKKTGKQIDESSDTYDTVEWLVKNVANNNGNVGMWGISYPGFYAATGMIDAHPALKAVSPQAPIADWFIGDDMHHNGAFYLIDSFNFFTFFGPPRPKPTTEFPPPFKHGTPDAYKFFLEMGAVSNANPKYLKGNIGFWNDFLAHPNYDEFWKSRNLLPHLKKVAPAVMTVGGWFDAEDLYGPLHIYDEIERNNPGIHNVMVIGPWFHGGWARSDGSQLGNAQFGSKTSEFYRSEVELKFFNHFLKGEGELNQPEVLAFQTGSNQWKSYESWPPKGTIEKTLYFHPNGKLSFDAPKETGEAFDQYVSDPAKPVPYTNEITISRGREYMTEDQRFASQRPDVLVYKTDVLTEDVTLSGKLLADLFISTTGTDADFVVKLIDVFPDDTPNADPNPTNFKMGGYEMLVRGEVMRAKYRESFETPSALRPNTVTRVPFNVQDVNHTFKKGHRIMIQVQSSWFPLVDRNPQKFCDIYKATDADFTIATHRVYRDAKHASGLKVHVAAQ
jgi:putative CocE/NonD family hydrolase